MSSKFRELAETLVTQAMTETKPIEMGRDLRKLGYKPMQKVHHYAHPGYGDHRIIASSTGTYIHQKNGKHIGEFKTPSEAHDSVERHGKRD